MYVDDTPHIEFNASEQSVINNSKDVVNVLVENSTETTSESPSSSDIDDDSSSCENEGSKVDVVYKINDNWDNNHTKDDLCKEVSLEDIQNYKVKNGLNRKMSKAQIIEFKMNEKREMLRYTTNEEIKNVLPNIFQQDRDTIDVKVSRMSHARRFWLTVKFCR